MYDSYNGGKKEKKKKKKERLGPVFIARTILTSQRHANTRLARISVIPRDPESASVRVSGDARQQERWIRSSIIGEVDPWRTS